MLSHRTTTVVGRAKLEEQLCWAELHLGYTILFEGIFYVAKQFLKKATTGGRSSSSLLNISGHNYYLF